MIDASIDRLSNDLVDAVAEHRPDQATFAGIPGHDSAWGEMGPGAAETWDHTLATFERRIAAEGAPSDRWSALGLGMIGEYVSEQRTAIGNREHLVDLNSIDSTFQYLRLVFDMMDQRTHEGWVAVATRLETLDAPVSGLCATLGEGARLGEVVAKRQVRAVAAQSRVAAGEASFTHDLPLAMDRAGIGDAALRRRVERGGEIARRAFTKLADHLEQRYLPHAREADPVGRDRYLRAARRFLGTTIDPIDTYAWGWHEVHAIEERMRRLASEIRPGATLREVIDLLDTDPARAAGNVDAFLELMRERQERALSELAGTHFEIPEQIRRIDVKLAPPGGSIGAYYVPPNEDFSRAGTIWYAPGPSSTFPLWGEITTAYHEGFPGHHLQCGLQVYLADRLTRLHRFFVMYSGHAEGWALYAEELMDELGYFERPEYALGMLAGKLVRACRVVVDIGLHLELPIPKDETFHPGETWRHDLAATFMHRRAFLKSDHAESDVTRYLGWPGQAISYKVGERAMLELRAEARRRDGSSFDLRRFHDLLIGSGSVGLDRLRSIVRDKPA